MALEVGDIVLCTVESIVGTNVFVRLENGEEGCIVFSEVAPGRIRNIREYVVPQKKIVCKVLRLSHDRIDLSLRRVTQKEQKELRENFKLEKSYDSILRGILKDKANEVKKAILSKSTLHAFLEDAKTDSKELEKIVGKEDSKKILEIINTQHRKKKIVLKREISLTTSDSDGLTQIKKVFEKAKGTVVKYISAGKYVLVIESDDVKRADGEITLIVDSIEKEAKKLGMEFSILKK